MTWQAMTAGSSAPAELLLTWLVQSSVLLAIGLILGRVSRRWGPAVQSAVYRTTLAAVLLCPIASFAMAAMGFGGWVLRLPQVAGVEQAPPTLAGRVASITPASMSLNPPAQIEPQPASPTEEIPDPARPRMPAASIPGASVIPTTGEPLPQIESLATTSVVMMPAIGLVARLVPAMAGLWVLVAATLIIRLAVGQSRMARLRLGAVPADLEAESLCKELAGQMRLNPPSVLRSPFLSSPCLDGLRRPAILLPEEAEANLRETFIHELAHLSRRDGLWNLLRRVASALFWFQPLLWVLSRRIEESAEEVCDDFVVAFGSDRTQYAGHLLELAGRTLPPLAPAGVGMISLPSMLGRRIRRILDSSRQLSTRAGRRAIAATLIAGLAGTILTGLVGVGTAARAVPANKPKVVFENLAPTTTIDTNGDRIARKIEDPPASAIREMPITGRILDLEGRPVAGVKVRVSEIMRPKGGDLSPWLEAIRLGEPLWVAYKHVEKEKDETKVPKGFVETGKDGRFRLGDITAECWVRVTIEGPTIAFATLEVVTRKMEPFKANGFTNTFGPGVQTIHGADFTYTAAPGRAIEGVVLDAKTQKPMADVGVWSYGFAGSTFVGIKSLKTRTDSAGRFKIEGMPKGRGNKLFIVPNDDQPYFMQEVAVSDTAGLGPVAVEVVLHRGIFIEGKVTEKGTGKPVAGAFMHYFPFLDNPFAQQTPEFRRGGYTDGAGHQDRYKSKADGSYRLVGLPGRAIVGAVDYSGKPYRRGAGSESIKGMNKNGHFPTWNNPVPPGRYFPTSMKEITPDAKAEVVHLDIEMDPGAKVGLRVVDPQGKPVEGVSAIGRADRGSQDREPQSASTFDVESLGPGEDRTVVIQHEARKLGRVIHVKPGDDAKERVVVKLEPAATITGRVVDADGQPVPGALVGTQPQPGGDFSPRLPEIVSGKDGRFTFANLPVGCQYGLFARSGASYVDTKFAFKRDINVRPGETTDIGDLKFDRN